MSREAKLVAGSKFEVELDPVGAPDVFTEIKGITSTGVIGDTSEFKDQTTIDDEVKRYGAAMGDTAESTLKGYYYPDDADQKSFVALAKARATVKCKFTWKSGLVADYSLVLSGFQIDDGTAEDWQMFTIPSRVSGETAWTDPV